MVVLPILLIYIYSKTCNIRFSLHTLLYIKLFCLSKEFDYTIDIHCTQTDITKAIRERRVSRHHGAQLKAP